MKIPFVLIACLFFPFMLLNAEPLHNPYESHSTERSGDERRAVYSPDSDTTLRADDSQYHPSYIQPFALITIPKSGSHLAIKALYFLTGGVPFWHTRFPSYQYVPGNVGFLYTHFCLSPELENNYRELPNLKKIVLVRDLRDVAISIVYHIRKSLWPGLTSQERQSFLRMSFDEQLSFVIDFDYVKKTPNSLQVSLIQVARQAVQYSQNPNHLILRYEDLVGPSGGGDFDAQCTQMRRICEFLQLGLPEIALHEAATKMYGDAYNPFGGDNGFQNFRSTFRAGVVGRWKTVFTEEHKLAFKKKLGKMLIALGYEKNDSW